MKACNEKLRSALEEAMTLAEAREVEEMADMEPHEFSEEFERKMKELFAQLPTRRRKRKNIMRYMAASIVAVFLIVGVLVGKTITTDASWFGLNITQWLEDFFRVDTGEGKRKEDAVLFEEAQIGYLPEGFKKVAQGVSFSSVYYKYQNDNQDYIMVQVFRDKGMLDSDSTEIICKDGINEDGYEYQYIQKTDLDSDAVIWRDQRDAYYQVTSTLNKEEIFKIMNEIIY